MNRYSPQRELILHIVASHEGHWSADQVYLAAKEQMPRLSRATVYRNLEFLEEVGQLQRMVAPNHISYFERMKGPHHHFVCTKCDAIQDYQAPSVNACFSCVAKQNNFDIQGLVTTLYGTCEACQLIQI